MTDQITRPAPDPVVAAIDTVARHLVAAMYRSRREVDLSDYDGVGETDWDAVSARADEIVQSIEPAPDAYIAAEQLLAARPAPAKEESTCD